MACSDRFQGRGRKITAQIQHDRLGHALQVSQDRFGLLGGEFARAFLVLLWHGQKPEATAVALEVGQGRRDGVRVAVDYRDLGAGGGEAVGDGEADAARATGDDGDSIGEIEVAARVGTRVSHDWSRSTNF